MFQAEIQPIEPLPHSPAFLRDIIPPGKGRVSSSEYLDRIRSGQKSGMKSLLAILNRHPNSTFCIVGGGPTLQDKVGALRKLANRGAIILAVNKSHDWLLKRGLPCHYAVLLDPKEWVADYIDLNLAKSKEIRRRAGKLWVEPTYLIASQCHDRTIAKFKDLPNAYLWHAAAGLGEGEILCNEFEGGLWVTVPGASVVGLRAPFIAHGLGAETIHLFGIDGSAKTPTPTETREIYKALCPGVPIPDHDGIMGFLMALMAKNKKLPEEISNIFRKHHYAYAKPHIDPTWKSFSVKLKSGWNRAFIANHHMARAVYEFEDAMKDWDKLIQQGKMRPFSIRVHGDPKVSAIAMVAAGMGVHADPVENERYGKSPDPITYHEAGQGFCLAR